MKKLIPAFVLLFAFIMSACGSADNGGVLEGSPPPAAPVAPETGVAFTSPKDGDTVSNPVKIQMEATGLTIEPAGEVHENAGHFHVIVDADCVEAGQIIPTDDAHRHFGMAQTEAELTLAPGEHTLCLQLGDGAHTALDFTETISVSVE